MRNAFQTVAMPPSQVVDAAGSGGSTASEPEAIESGSNMVNGRKRPNTDRVRSVKRAEQPYGVVVFAVPATAKLTKRGSVMAVRATFPVLSSGVHIEAIVWASVVKATDGDRVVPEIGFPRGVSFPDDGDRRKIESHIGAAALEWDGYDAAMDAAENRLTNTFTEADAALPARKVRAIVPGVVPALAPRVVKRS